MIRTTSAHNNILYTRSVCVAILVFLGSIASGVYGRHYIRFQADFSYARDFASKGIETPDGEKISLDDARAWIGAGWAEPISKSNGFSPAAGIGYRYTHKALIVDAGLGVEYRIRSNQPYDITRVTANHVDDTGEPYIGTHSWTNRRTTLQNIGVNIPVMAGFEIKRVYAMAGIKANMDVWGLTREKGDYTMTGKYVRFMDELENVPGHGLVSNEAYETSAVVKGLVWDIRACAEVGYCIYGAGKKKSKFTTKGEPRYYVGAFAEYAFVGTAKHYLPLLAGVRLTALLPLPEPKHCNCLGY